MAITYTWTIPTLERHTADGGVYIAHWRCTGVDDDGNSASSYGTCGLTYDASASDYIAYADLTEADVLGWVYDSLIEGDETAAEAKARIEAERTAKVQGQIDRAATQDTGVPW